MKFVKSIVSLATAVSLLGGSLSAESIIDVGEQTGTYSGDVRGFFFTAPTSFKIQSVDVPTDASSANFNVVILKFDELPPTFDSSTNTYQVLGEFRDSAEKITGLNIGVNEGDIIGVLGNRGDVNSYAAPLTSRILGKDVELTRLLSQNAMSTLSEPFSAQVSAEEGGSISRVFLGIPTPPSNSRFGPDRFTAAADVIPGNYSTCDGKKWVGGFRILDGENAGLFIEDRYKDECFKGDVTFLPPGIRANNKRQVIAYLGENIDWFYHR